MGTKIRKRRLPTRLDGGPNSREAAVAQVLSKQSIEGVWDFSKDGGATGDYAGFNQFPKNAGVTDLWVRTETATTSGGSMTYQLKAGSTALSDAIAYDDATDPIDATGWRQIALASSADVVDTGADPADFVFTIAGAAATAGKVRFWAEFMSSADAD